MNLQNLTQSVDLNNLLIHTNHENSDEEDDIKKMMNQL